MENVVIKMDVGLSQILKDTFLVFANAYHNYADLIVSSMFSNIGAYDIVPQISKLDKFAAFSDQIALLQGSYIWSDVQEVSIMLQHSFLYRVTHEGSRRMSYFNDEVLSKTMKRFKASLINCITEHGIFLANCDIEACSLFMYTNGGQAITKDVFASEFHKARSDLMKIHQDFRGKVPKVFNRILDDLQYIIDVRGNNAENLVLPATLTKWPKFQKFQREEFVRAIKEVPSCSISELHNHLYIIYAHSIPFFTMSMFSWLIIMQGSKASEAPSILETFDEDLLENLLNFKSIMQEDCILYMRRELTTLPFMVNVLNIIDDTNFFQNYSYVLLGESPLCMIKQVHSLYKSNINALVLADILSVGFYDVIDTSKQVPHESVTSMLMKAKKDVDTILECFEHNLYMFNIVKRSIFVIEEAIKKISRYEKWLLYVNDNVDNTLHERVDILFGNVLDEDGYPRICSICLDTSEERNDTWFPLCCNHIFHMECINNLLHSQMTTCPLCRKDM
jgi:hypothetical protein